eukprot:TRINITY_DN13900_c0_g1_i1.p1 TRINITY_DN13900_c0_g1~~TRINITY_DN13900_c0_g1_i1.p1  ORF type:complete len:245 (+),score=25.83 TRINITY_DN13900_c0_g1_i1:54-788(+)
MEITPVSPPPASVPPPSTPPPGVYEPDQILQIRQQMFPVILTTYGIPADSERARSLALLLGVNEHEPYYHPVNVPRIGYHQQWGGAPAAHALLHNYTPFSNVPDDVLTLILSYENIPRALMYRWYNISKQWRRCLTTPLLGYYDFLRMCMQSLNRRSGGVLDPIELAYPSTPRPYTPSIAVMRCMSCQKSSIMEQHDGGTMWGHCMYCGTDGQFDLCKGEAGELLNRFPQYIRTKTQPETDEPR